MRRNVCLSVCLSVPVFPYIRMLTYLQLLCQRSVKCCLRQELLSITRSPSAHDQHQKSSTVCTCTQLYFSYIVYIYIISYIVYVCIYIISLYVYRVCVCVYIYINIHIRVRLTKILPMSVAFGPFSAQQICVKRFACRW